MLILPMLFDPFSATRPENKSSGGTHLMVTGDVVVGQEKDRGRSAKYQPR